MASKKVEDKPQELVKAAASDVPSYMQSGVKSSFAGKMRSEDMQVPRIRLLQAISPEIEGFKGIATAGEFWHNGDNVAIGKEISFFVLSQKYRYVLYAPRGDDRLVLARADDGVNWDKPNTEFEVKLKGIPKPIKWNTGANVAAGGLAKFGTSIPGDDDSQPAATLIYDYVIWIPALGMSPAVMSLTRSQIKRAKGMNFALSDAALPEALRFVANITKEEGAEGPYFNYQFRRAGMATDEEFEISHKMAERFATLAYTVVGDDRDETGSAAPSDGPKEVPKNTKGY